MCEFGQGYALERANIRKIFKIAFFCGYFQGLARHSAARKGKNAYLRCMKRTLFLIFLLSGALSVAFGQKLRPAAIFQNGMVLQRELPIRIWGRAKAGSMVQARLLKEHPATARTLREGVKVVSGKVVASGECAASESGVFSLSLPPLQAGGPYELHLSDEGDSYIYKGVWVGEVWLCSGQSNMELRVGETDCRKYNLAMADTLSRVHFYNMESLWPVYAEVWGKSRADSIDRGLFIRPAHWERCSARAASRFSAIGFTFARILADSLGCHVGVVSNAVGGSTTEGWTDSLALRGGAPEILQGAWTDNDSIMGWARRRAKLNLKEVGEEGHSHPYAPGYLFHAAIAPISGYTMRGVLWYQGESNAELTAMHERLFPLLEQSWRTAWQSPSLPFFTVQLSGISTRPAWPAFRDSQRRLARRLPHTYMTVCSDVGDSLNIHPPRKRIVGTRLARQALHHVYGFEKIVPSGPEPVCATIVGKGNVSVRFAQADGLRSLSPMQSSWFELQGADGQWHAARQAAIVGDSVILGSSGAGRPIAVRYAWKPFTRAAIANGAGMPCSTFQIGVRPGRALP